MDDDLARAVEVITARISNLEEREKALAAREKALCEVVDVLVMWREGLAVAVEPCPDCGLVGGRRVKGRCRRCYRTHYGREKRARERAEAKTSQAQNGQGLPGPRERERLGQARTRELIAAGKDRDARRAEGQVDSGR